MFIPTVKVKIEIGDSVILKHDVDVLGGFFTKGHIFNVINMYDVYGYYNKFFDGIDSDGIVIKKLNSDNFYKNINYYDAKKIQSKRNHKNKVLKSIKDNCRNKTVEYDDRYTYDGCKLKTCNMRACKVKLDCIVYSDVSKEKYPGILRYLKIKKLKKDETEN